MDDYLIQPVDRQRIIWEQAQAQLNLPDTSLEKDYWVCWTLRELFSLPEWGPRITFKGGTSLSKCWGLINRFSEDIDIVIDKSFLGFGHENSPEEASSKSQLKKRLNKMKGIAQKKIRDELLPELKMRIGKLLPDSQEWTLDIAPEDEDSSRQTLLFKYPSVMLDTESYVRRVVKIEMGARSDNEPAHEKEIQPYLSEVFPDVVGSSRYYVRALAVERTFWEKAMLLHEETYRPAHKKRDSRMARHYYDLWCLITAGVAQEASKRDDIFKRTSQHREIYFNNNWMDYGTLRKGSLCLLPSEEQEPDWRRDYQAMNDAMFFGEVPDFSEVLRVVGNFERQFNQQ